MAHIDKSVQKTLIIVGAIVLLAVFGFFAFSSFSSNNTVTGNGEATVKAIPDLVGVYFSVDTTGTTSQEATQKNSEIVDNLTSMLLAQGFDKSKIQTMSFNVYPDYNWVNGKQVDNGFSATHSIRVEIPTSDSQKIGSVIDAGVSAGAGISYINFELSQTEQNNYKAQSLKLATEDAKIKAQAIADGLGKRIGRLVSVSDNSFNYSPRVLYSASGSGVSSDANQAKEATTNIQPGEQDISASVTAVFKLM
jgi:uncharacterized protein YggE